MTRTHNKDTPLSEMTISRDAKSRRRACFDLELEAGKLFACWVQLGTVLTTDHASVSPH
jgi:hypothetical protein